MPVPTPSPRTDRAALVFGWIAVVPLAVLAAVWVFSVATLEGSDRFQMLNLLVVFAAIGGLCLALGILAIVFGGWGARRLPVALGWSAIALIGVCLGCLAAWTLF